MVSLSLNQQEKLSFDDGLTQILQPIHAVVGIEFRQSNYNYL